MGSWLEGIVDPALAPAAGWAIIVVAALLAVYIVLRLVRAFRSGTFISGGRNRKTRLAVMDATAIDDKRRLVLVRRDDIEHLILIGGSSDLVVERDIRMIPRSRAAGDANENGGWERTARPVAQPAPGEMPPQPAPARRDQPQPVQPRAEQLPQRRPAPAPQLPQRQPPVMTTPQNAPVSQPAPRTAPPPAAPAPAAPPAPAPTIRVEAPYRPAMRPTEAPRAPAPETPPRPVATTPLAATLPPSSGTFAQPAVAPKATVAAPQQAQRPAQPQPADELDSALLSELETSLTVDEPGRKSAGNDTLDDEMAKLLGELSRERG